MRRSTLLAALLLIAVALAGCHETDNGEDMDPGAGGDGDGSGDGDGGDGDGDTEPLEVTLTPQDPPTTVTAGEAFQITVDVEASRTATSVHSGFHWGFNSSADAEPADYTQFLTMASPHAEDENTYPGSYTIPPWTIGEEHAGQTVYLRAHTIIEGNHYWGEEFSFMVMPAS